MRDEQVEKAINSLLDEATGMEAAIAVLEKHLSAFKKALEEIAAGNLDDETDEEFAARAKGVASIALRAYMGRWIRKGDYT